jgi:hypothetical protein
METKYWLRMLEKAYVGNGDSKLLWKEAQELTLIFSKIATNST